MNYKLATYLSGAPYDVLADGDEARRCRMLHNALRLRCQGGRAAPESQSLSVSPEHLARVMQVRFGERRGRLPGCGEDREGGRLELARREHPQHVQPPHAREAAEDAERGRAVVCRALACVQAAGEFEQPLKDLVAEGLAEEGGHLVGREQRDKRRSRVEVRVRPRLLRPRRAPHALELNARPGLGRGGERARGRAVRGPCPCG
mmetsp:Transcript_10153/g.26352  ORF Transcript_10153/g.26352 Transcript_10153/m.26352 type:complete len:204 (+) Transcript_10153:43-654(+)